MMTKGKAAKRRKTLCSSHTSLRDSGEALPGLSLPQISSHISLIPCQKGLSDQPDDFVSRAERLGLLAEKNERIDPLA